MLFFSIHLICIGQSELLFPNENAIWCYGIYGDHNENYGSFCIKLANKKEFNGTLYNEIAYQSLPFNGDTAYYRVEDQKVFVLPKDSISEIMIYDFSLKIGDTFDPHGWGFGANDVIKLTVTSIDTIITKDNNPRNVFHLVDNTTGRFTDWIEGIGDTDWPFIFPSYTASVSGGFTFACFSKDNETIYAIENGMNTCGYSHVSQLYIDKLKIYPNPVKEVLYINNLSDGLINMQIYNSQGSLILSQNQVMNTEGLDVSQLKAGLYSIKLCNKTTRLIQKFVKIE